MRVVAMSQVYTSFQYVCGDMFLTVVRVKMVAPKIYSPLCSIHGGGSAMYEVMLSSWQLNLRNMFPISALDRVCSPQYLLNWYHQSIDIGSPAASIALDDDGVARPLFQVHVERAARRISSGR